MAETAKEARERRHAALLADPTIVEHGTVSTRTNYGCDCEPCREANIAYCRERRESQARLAGRSLRVYNRK